MDEILLCNSGQDIIFSNGVFSGSSGKDVKCALAKLQCWKYIHNPWFGLPNLVTRFSKLQNVSSK